MSSKIKIELDKANEAPATLEEVLAVSAIQESVIEAQQLKIAALEAAQKSSTKLLVKDTSGTGYYLNATKVKINREVYTAEQIEANTELVDTLVMLQSGLLTIVD